MLKKDTASMMFKKTPREYVVEEERENVVLIKGLRKTLFQNTMENNWC